MWLKKTIDNNTAYQSIQCLSQHCMMVNLTVNKHIVYDTNNAIWNKNVVLAHNYDFYIRISKNYELIKFKILYRYTYVQYICENFI